MKGEELEMSRKQEGKRWEKISKKTREEEKKLEEWRKRRGRIKEEERR